MLFDNPIFTDWYTDSMSVYRNTDAARGNMDKKERKLVAEHIPCRICRRQGSGPKMRPTAATAESADKLACDLNVDIRAGDELLVIRGGMLGMKGEEERYFAGRPHPYYDPVGGALSGLEHQEAALMTDEIIN